MGGTTPRPDVTVQLLQNGEVIDEVILNDANNWKNTWSELVTNDESGKKFIYTVDEINVPTGYKNQSMVI